MEKEHPLLSANRDSLFEEIKNDINNVITKINSYEKIRLLGALGSTIDGGIEILRPALPNILETSVEYALSIATASENNYNAPIPSAEDMIHILGVLEKIREKYLKYIFTENNTEQYSPFEQKLRSKVIESTLTVRGEGYRVHIDEIFLELFDRQKILFEKHYNFDADDILNIIIYIEEGLERNRALIKQEHRDFVKWMEKQNINELAKKYMHLPQDPFLISKMYQLETRKSPKFKSVDDSFKFYVDELEEREVRVIEELSVKFGDNNSFLDPRFKGFPLNDTVISSKPILYSPEQKSHYCFSTRILHRNIFSIGEALLKNADETYYQDVFLNNVAKGRSTYFEEKVQSLISKIITEHKAHGNLQYRVKDEEFEIDVLIETQEYIFLVEVKSGLFSNAARRGAIKSFKSSLRNIVEYAFEQLERTEKYLSNHPNPRFYDENGEIFVDTSKEIIKIAVSFASIMGITNQIYELGRAGILTHRLEPPLSISIFELMVMAEVFKNNEKDFLEFIKARVSLYQEEGFKIENELDFLGLYLSRDYRKVMKVYRRQKFFVVDEKFRSKIDSYFDSKLKGLPFRLPRKVQV